MTKIELIEKAILNARLTKNDLAKNLLQTLKGEYEMALKNGESATDALVEKIAKKMVKNNELISSEDALKEIEILKSYLPEELSEADLKSLVAKVINELPEKVALFKAGNKSMIGALMGEAMKQSRNAADPKSLGKILNEALMNV